MDKHEAAFREPYPLLGSPIPGTPLPLDADDEKHVSSLSTALVASIQDAKDHISHIEYIFCTHLFPHFQSNSKKLQTLCDSLDRCRDKENALSVAIEQLRAENRRVSEENRVLKDVELEAKRRRIEELEREVESVECKGPLLAERERELRESEDKRNMLEIEVEGFEREKKLLMGRISDLDEKLRARSREVEELGGLLEKLRLENEALVEKVKHLEERIDEAEGSCRELGERVESLNSELQGEKTKKGRLTEAYKRLKSQYNYLREKVGLTEENMLNQNISEGNAFERSDTSMDECELAKVKIEIPEEDFGGLENTTPEVFVAVCDTTKVKDVLEDDDKGANMSPPSSISRGVSKCRTSKKQVSVSGKKRSASSWRQTRAHHSRAGPDPHDDFLDTPLENIRENLNGDLSKEDLQNQIENDIVMNSSDDETQDLNARSSSLKKQSSISVANRRNFKYIEPVRKKAERENLKGVECKQCRKFYEAVLPNADGKDPDGNKQNFRCEHLDGVSRHRYKYVPPMTPEGFWNIGFESEM